MWRLSLLIPGSRYLNVVPFQFSNFFALCSDSLVLSAKIKQENYKAATVSAR